MNNPPVNEENIKISQLADDTIIFVNSIESGNIAIKEVKTFGVLAGPKLNLMKTSVMSTGIQEECLNNLEWTNEPIKYLGVYITKDRKESESLNWNLKLEKAKSLLRVWKMRNLTYYGKVTIIKTLIVSQFVYIATCLPIPQNIIVNLNRLIYSFLWGSKKDKVKRAVVTLNAESWGLDMVDIQTKFRSLQLSWFSKYIKGGKSQWRILFKYWVSFIQDVPTFLKLNCSGKDMLSLCKMYKLPLFYVNLLTYWCELRYVHFPNVKDIRNEILWYNSNIKHGRNVLFFKDWNVNGIRKVSDLFENGQWLSCYSLYERLGTSSLLVNFKFSKLKNAFPKVWAQKIRSNIHSHNETEISNEMFEISNGDLINLSHMKAKHFYIILNISKIGNPSVSLFWQEVLNLPIDFDWRHVLNFKLKKIKENKVRQFNFKLLHNVLPFKDNLYKWKITTDISCKFCNEQESLIHILLRCRQVATFWKRIHHLVITLFKTNILIDEELMIIGLNTDDSDFMLINVLIIYAQYAIYKVYILNHYRSKSFNSHSIWMTFKNDFMFYVTWQFKKQKKLISSLKTYLF